MADKQAHQNYINQLQNQLATVKKDAATFQKELEQKNDILRQQEVNYIALFTGFIVFCMYNKTN